MLAGGKLSTFADLAKRAAASERLNKENNENNNTEEQTSFLFAKDNADTNKENEMNNGMTGSASTPHSYKPTGRMQLTRQNTYSTKDCEEEDNEKENIPLNPGFQRWRGTRSSDNTRATVRAKLVEHLRKIAEERLTVRQIFARYVESSTLHGFRYSCSDTYYIRRFIWACLMILGAIYFIIKLKEGIIEYFDYPFSTLSTVDYVETLKFPAISFCAVNGFSISKIERSELSRLYKNNRLPLERDWQDPGYDIPGDKLRELIKQTSISIDTLFQDCEWIKRDTSHPDVPMNYCHSINFTSYFNNRGQLCYTLNSGKEGHRLLEVNHEGLIYGYELLFDLNITDAVKSFPYSGLEVIVHDQSETPVLNDGFIISPGFKTFVRMNTLEVCNFNPILYIIILIFFQPSRKYMKIAYMCIDQEYPISSQVCKKIWWKY